MPDHELEGPQAACQQRHFIAAPAGRTCKVFSRGGDSRTEHELLSAFARLFLASQLVSTIFSFTAILLLHQKTGAKAKTSVNSLCSAPVGTKITQLIMCSVAAVLPARSVYGRFQGPCRRQGGFFTLKRFLPCHPVSGFRLVPEL